MNKVRNNTVQLNIGRFPLHSASVSLSFEERLCGRTACRRTNTVSWTQRLAARFSLITLFVELVCGCTGKPACPNPRGLWFSPRSYNTRSDITWLRKSRTDWWALTRGSVSWRRSQWLRVHQILRVTRAAMTAGSEPSRKRQKALNTDEGQSDGDRLADLAAHNMTRIIQEDEDEQSALNLAEESMRISVCHFDFPTSVVNGSKKGFCSALEQIQSCLWYNAARIVVQLSWLVSLTQDFTHRLKEGTGEPNAGQRGRNLNAGKLLQLKLNGKGLPLKDQRWAASLLDSAIRQRH